MPAAIDRFISSGAADSLFRRFVRNHTAVTPVTAVFAWTVAQSDSAPTPDPRFKFQMDADIENFDARCVGHSPSVDACSPADAVCPSN